MLEFLVDEDPTDIYEAAYHSLGFGMKIHIARLQKVVLCKRFRRAEKWLMWFLDMANPTDGDRRRIKREMDSTLKMERNEKMNKFWRRSKERSEEPHCISTA